MRPWPKAATSPRSSTRPPAPAPASRSRGGGGWRGGERRLRGTLLPVPGSSSQDLLEFTAAERVERPGVGEASIAGEEPGCLRPWRSQQCRQHLFESGQHTIIGELPGGIEKPAAGLERQQLVPSPPLVDGLLGYP